MQVAPIDADTSESRLIIAMDHAHEMPEQHFTGFQDLVSAQDKVVVESQRPERVPFDLAAELHLKFDAVAVAYRKAMRGCGLTRS